MDSSTYSMPEREGLEIVGSDQFFKQFPHRARVQITLLPPLVPRTGESALALTDRLMFTLAQALPTVMRGLYKELPGGFTM